MESDLNLVISDYQIIAHYSAYVRGRFCPIVVKSPVVIGCYDVAFGSIHNSNFVDNTKPPQSPVCIVRSTTTETA